MAAGLDLGERLALAVLLELKLICSPASRRPSFFPESAAQDVGW
jgi:hypothetical protein